MQITRSRYYNLGVNLLGLPRWLSEELALECKGPSSIPGWERSSGERKGNPLHYSCLENPMDRGAWWVTVHGVAESGMTERLNNNITAL